MKAILDTNTFLRAIMDDRKLSQRARQIFIGPNDLWLSVASLWEILLKVRIGKLPLPKPTAPYIAKKLSQNRIEVLAITWDHVAGIESLPLHHGDPFDRIIIAQAKEEGLPVVTADLQFERYPIKTIW